MCCSRRRGIPRSGRCHGEFAVLVHVRHVVEPLAAHAGVALQSLLCAELFHEFCAGIRRRHLESAIAQLFGRLLQQIQTIYNKVEFGNLVLLGVIVYETMRQ